MKIKVNGKEEIIEGSMSLMTFVLEKELNPERIVIEYNLDILSKEQWESTVLKDEDKLEILCFMGGGC
ncbi:sulfur carrier protein [Natranaerovirga pectinivora]|uniref:Sulfur carrier protein n=1 Tax=Natranaerovirga pectinivora TaxID=682400 RepID=A0A4V2V0F0_9FIRM|nr:sulfur carrier protein ThiS [Natranaerovirga pectinivora]TCT15650.1 sulfur carrier protein [Natranaerovirga pectinivora]